MDCVREAPVLAARNALLRLRGSRAACRWVRRPLRRSDGLACGSVHALARGTHSERELVPLPQKGRGAGGGGGAAGRSSVGGGSGASAAAGSQALTGRSGSIPARVPPAAAVSGSPATAGTDEARLGRRGGDRGGGLDRCGVAERGSLRAGPALRSRRAAADRARRRGPASAGATPGRSAARAGSRVGPPPAPPPVAPPPAPVRAWEPPPAPAPLPPPPPPPPAPEPFAYESLPAVPPEPDPPAVAGEDRTRSSRSAR